MIKNKIKSEAFLEVTNNPCVRMMGPPDTLNALKIKTPAWD